LLHAIKGEKQFETDFITVCPSGITSYQ